MDDTKKLLLSLILISAFLGASAFTAEVEYIGPEKQKQLEAQFDQAGFSASKDTKSLKDRSWSCDMYGVRSRMQVHHELKLYKWSNDPASPSWHNDGAQLVNDYKVENSALVGIHDRIKDQVTQRYEDQVKLTPDGQLISRLSVISPAKMVVAYSVCKGI